MNMPWQKLAFGHWNLLPELEEGQVFLFGVSLSTHVEELEKMHSVLSNDEIERAERYHFEGDRELFILRRGITRSLLSHFVNSSPEELSITQLRRHKPEMTGGRLQFTMSGSGDFFLLALAIDQEIGVDIEHISEHPALELVVEENFTPKEQEWLKAASASEWHEHFFQIWTRKEAVLKAIGKGLSWPMAEIEVLDPQNCRLFGEKLHDLSFRAEWICQSLDFPEKDLLGYLAYQGNTPKFKPFFLT